jgi:hypothetical protein
MMGYAVKNLMMGCLEYTYEWGCIAGDFAEMMICLGEVMIGI